MIKELGEAYWRRDYQLPHIVVCPTHRIPLSKSQIERRAFSKLYNRADKISCPADAPTVIITPGKTQMDIFSRLAERSIGILHNPPEDQARRSITSNYLDRLWRKGFFRSQKQVNKNILGQSIYNQFQSIALFWPKLLDDSSRPPDWFTHLIKHQDLNNSTIYHVMLQDFLDNHPDLTPELGRISWKPRPKIQDIGGEPWKCYNPLIKDPLHANICVSRVNYIGPDLRIHFRCICDYEYIVRKNPDGSFVRRRLCTFGKSLGPHIEQAMREGWTLKQTAKLARMDTSTLKRQAKKLGILELPAA